MKKLITIFAALALVIIICATLLPTESQAATIVDSGTCGDDLTWVLDDTGTLTISGTGTMTDFVYSNYSTSAPWYGKRDRIIKVVIGDGVPSIGEWAFYYCDSLTSIVIPDGVTGIGNYAFSDCTSLTSINIPDSVTSIGTSAFYGCSSLTSVTIPDSVTSIGYSAFYNCTNLTNITIPDSVTTIGYATFGDCSSLTSVTIGNGVTGIGSFAFADCSSLTKIIYCGTREQWSAISVGSNNEVLDNVTLQFHNWGGASCTESKTCTICGASSGGALGHSYTLTDNSNGTHTYTCSVCGDSATENHAYIDNACACGHKLVDMIKSSQATLEAVLRLDFTMDKTKLPGTDNYVVLTHTYANGSTDVVTIPQSEWANSGMVSYSKIAAKEMGDNVTIVAYNAKGQQLSIPKVDSIKAYAYRGLTALVDYNTGKNATLRTLLVDMLNYGAAAQVQFGYDTANLVNADLTETQKSWATKNDVTPANNQIKDAATYNTTLVLESAIEMDCIFYASKIGAYETWGDLYAIATYTDFNGNVKTVRIEGEDFGMYNNRNYALVPVIGMAVADYQSIVTCVVYDANGNALATAIDSVEGYAYRALASGRAGETLENLCKAMMKFSASAHAYFKK